MYQASIDGVTVADYIQRFEIEKVSEEDTTEIVANKLAEYYGKTDPPFLNCSKKSGQREKPPESG